MMSEYTTATLPRLDRPTSGEPLWSYAVGASNFQYPTEVYGCVGAYEDAAMAAANGYQAAMSDAASHNMSVYVDAAAAKGYQPATARGYKMVQGSSSPGWTTYRAVAPDVEPEAPVLEPATIVSSGSATIDRMSVFYGLLELTTRPVGWDGYEGLPASTEAAVAAFKFMERLPFDQEEPELELAGDGEVTLVWRKPDLYLEVGFHDGVHYSYFGRFDGPGQQTVAGDGLCQENLIPADLNAYLAQFGHGHLRLRAA